MRMGAEEVWPDLNPAPPSAPRLPAGLWRRALTAFEQMKAHNCRPDSVVYNTIIGSLWATGLVWAQAKATQIFHAACRQGHFRLTVHTLEAGAPAAAAAAPAPAVGSPSALAALAAAAAPAAAGLSAFAGVGSASGSNSLPASGAGSRSASPAVSLPQAIALKGASSGQLTSGAVTPSDLVSPGTCGTPLSALAAACAASLSPSSSPLNEGSLAAAAAAAALQAGTATNGTGAGTVIEFGMHAFTVGSAVLSLLRWVAELRERLPREPNKDLKQQVGADLCCNACGGAWYAMLARVRYTLCSFKAPC